MVRDHAGLCAWGQRFVRNQVSMRARAMGFCALLGTKVSSHRCDCRTSRPAFNRVTWEAFDSFPRKASAARIDTTCEDLRRLVAEFGSVKRSQCKLLVIYTTMSHTTLSHTTFSHTTLYHPTLSCTTLSHTTLSHTTLSHTILSHTTLK